MMAAVQSITGQRFDLAIPLPKMLTSKEELTLDRAALAREPGSYLLLLRLAATLVRLDHFEEAITLLQAHGEGDVRQLNLLHAALLGSESAEANLLALPVAEQCVRASRTSAQRANALAALGKTHIRLGNNDTARASLEEALALDPNQKDAYKRLFGLYLAQDPEKALALARSTVAAGVVHSRVLGSLPLALARLGRIAEARKAEALDEFLLHKQPETPQGWPTRAAFHQALAAEILDHPDIRYERYGAASSRTWRVDEPSLHRSHIFPQLQALIRREVIDHVATLPQAGHPFLRARPAPASLRNWCVITQGDGHETWHVHQNGWMSGVYYIQVPDHIALGTGRDGCIAFGLPEDVIGSEASSAFGERIIRPRAGLMMLFPSHVFHRTYPHFGSGQRICFAFDIVPVAQY